MPARKPISLCALLLAGALVVAAVLWLVSAPVERTAGPMRQDAYVWRRDWSPDVVARVARDAGALDGLVVLAAEIDFDGPNPTVTRVKLPFDALCRYGGPVSLAVRVNAYDGSFSPDADASRAVVDACLVALADAGDARLAVEAMHLDFDCPTRRLADYRFWVEEVRSSIVKMPLWITVLPTWMTSRAFGPLIAETDGYVLQVHALSRPDSIEAIEPLCDPDRARAWVESAARYDRPFVVALPTYRHLLAFDAGGAYLGAASERGLPAWGSEVRLRVVGADAEALGALVEAWRRDRPARMLGVTWFRLPVADERYNWRWSTLAAILAGRVPRPDAGVEVRVVDDALAEVFLANAGDADAPMDVTVGITWSGDRRPIARDAVAGFRTVDDAPGRWTIRPVSPFRQEVLAPGGRRMIAWLRFQSRAEVRADVRERRDE